MPYGIPYMAPQFFTPRTSGGGGFVPTDIVGCLSWLPKDGTALGAVSNWPNSGTDGHTEDAVQATGGNQPTATASVFGSHHGIVYNGSSDFLQTAGQIVTTAGTVFLVFSANSFSNAYTSLLSTESGAQGWTYLFKSNQKTAFYWSGASVTRFYDGSGAATLVLNTPVIAMIRWDASAGESRINGAVDGTFSAPFGTITGGGLFLGNSPFAGRLLDGAQGELVIYDTYLSDADANQVGNYMAGWSGISWTNI